MIRPIVFLVCFTLVGTALGAESAVRVPRRGDILYMRMYDKAGVSWQKVYGRTGEERPISAFERPDGGFLIFASCDSCEKVLSESAVWCIEIDSVGHVEAERCIDIPFGIFPQAVRRYVRCSVALPLSNEAFLLAGHCNYYTDNSYSDSSQHSVAWLAKVNSAGTVLWARSYPVMQKLSQTGTCGIADLDTLSNGDLVFAGVMGYWLDPTNTKGPCRNDAWVLRTNSEGEIVWQRTLSGDICEVVFDMAVTSDNSLLLCGSGRYIDESVGGHTELFYTPVGWMAKLNSKGRLLWERTPQSDAWTEFHAIRESGKDTSLVEEWMISDLEDSSQTFSLRQFDTKGRDIRTDSLASFPRILGLASYLEQAEKWIVAGFEDAFCVGHYPRVNPREGSDSDYEGLILLRHLQTNNSTKWTMGTNWNTRISRIVKAKQGYLFLGQTSSEERSFWQRILPEQ